MATLSHSESRRLYSWWWDSHISPKNSRWLQENLTDMDGKVKSMIKLIEEDADSFARRAEMYYKKRPELMKLVEEFYRAYRALAEKYNHASGELHYAKCAIEDAFPDQEPFELAEDSTPKSLSPEREPHTPKINLHARALFNADDLSENAWGRSASGARANNQTREGRGRKDLKREKDKVESLRDEMLQLSNENQNLKDKVSLEIERVGKAESEAQDLNIALGKAQLEKDELFIQYQQCVKKLSELEVVLDTVQKDSMRLDEKSSMAEIEILTLKESLVEMESKKISALVKHTKCLERISNLEAMITLVQEDRNGLDERAIKAEGEAQSLKDELSRLILENEAILVQYKQSLAKLSDLENIISAKEDNAKLAKMQAKRADSELAELKKILAELSKDKEASALQYNFCLETINKLQKDLMTADENVKQLENKVMIGAEKLKTAEQKCKLLDFSNQSLRVEADNLSKKIVLKDQELSDKQIELENLQARLQDEHLRYSQIETSLDNLQNLNSQSQDDRRALEQEFKNMLQMLKDLEVCKNGLEVEIQQVQDENHSLSQSNLSSTVKMENMQNEIDSLQKMKQWLEQEVSMQMDLSKSLQQQIISLKEEISDLNSSYESLIEQVKAAGLNPDCIGASLKSMEDENTRLKNACDEISNEKEFMSKKLECFEELLIKPSIRESFLMDLNGKLEGSSEQGKTLAESCRCLEKEKTELVAEKAYIFSQLQAVTENMHRLLEKNAVLENSLSTAKVELEGLREKSKGLEEICGLLKNERSYLLTERGNLALKLEDVEKKLECLENRFVGLEEDCYGFEKEKKGMHFQVEELKHSLVLENQELICANLRSETRFAGLEKHVHLLHQENLSEKNNLDEEVDRALKSQHEISILKTFMKDMEDKNYSLIIECQKHVEASKRAERVISELESENLEQQVETELLLDEIERLRLEIYQVFRALETGPDYVISEKIENEKTFVHHILGSIEGMKLSICKFEEEKQQLSVENSVLLTVIEQLDSEGIEIQSQKMCFEHEFNTMARNLAVVKNEKDKILEMNRQLKSDVNEVHHHAAKLGVELENVCVKQADLRKSYSTLQKALAEANQENTSLVKKYSNLEEEKCDADEQNDAALLELLSTANSSTVLCEFGMEKALELKLALTDLNSQQEVTSGLEKQLSILREQLRSQKTENFLLTDAVRKLEKKMKGAKEHNVYMKDLECEPSLFWNGIEEKIIAEDEKNELELWGSEAEAFFFDLQISSIHEVMFQDKVQELTGVCKTLEDERASKMLENELLNEKIYSMAKEIAELKSELNAYSPIIGTLRDDVAFLEHHMILQTTLKAARNESKFLECTSHPRRSMSKKVIEDQSLLSLQKLQTRMKAVRKLMEGVSNPHLLGRSNPNSNEEPPMNVINELQSRRSLGRDRHGLSRKKRHKLRGAPKLQKIKSKATEVWNGMLMKDITLDQLPSVSLHGFTSRGNAGIDDQTFEFWESSEAVKGDQTLGGSPMVSQKMMRMGIVLLDNLDSARHKMDSPSTDSDMLELSTQSSAFSIALDNEKIHERLASNVRKLEILQTAVENLRARLLMTQDSSKSKNIDFETVYEQLLEAEETVEHLGDMNVQIVKNIEWSYGESEAESPSEAQKMRKMKAMEQARKVSERVERLQLELQKIQYILLKFEDESKSGRRNKFFRSKTIILRDFIYNGRKNSGKRKKSPLCGCLKPSTSRNERSL